MKTFFEAYAMLYAGADILLTPRYAAADVGFADYYARAAAALCRCAPCRYYTRCLFDDKMLITLRRYGAFTPDMMPLLLRHTLRLRDYAPARSRGAARREERQRRAREQRVMSAMKWRVSSSSQRYQH